MPSNRPMPVNLWKNRNLSKGISNCLLFKGNGYTFSGKVTYEWIVCISFWKGAYSKRKEFAPKGSKFFPFRVDPFLEGSRCPGKQAGNHKSCLPCQKWQKFYQMCLVHINKHDRQHRYINILKFQIHCCNCNSLGQINIIKICKYNFLLRKGSNNAATC